MRRRIRSLIEREITRLDDASLNGGLDGSEIRSLELLVKVFREFAGDNDPKDVRESRIPIEELLVGVTDE